MSINFQVPVEDDKAAVVFPNCCVCCGAAKQAESRMILNRLVTRGRKQQPLKINFDIPHCERCARATRAVFLAGCIPFVLGFLLIGAATFLLVAFGAIVRGFDEYGKPNNSNSLVLGAAAGLFAGLAGGFLFEVLARVLLLPLMGSGLMSAPLFGLQLLRDSDYVAGLKAKLDSDGSSVHLTFLNDAVARQFRTLNPTIK
jgi:hypothetical protein